MKGLHQQIAAKRSDISGDRAKANDPEASAGESHDALERLPRLERQLADLSTSSHIGENAAAQTEEMIGKLRESPVITAELQLAIRDLETAGFRLRQHLGAKPD